jgi:hypothetical protein
MVEFIYLIFARIIPMDVGKWSSSERNPENHSDGRWKIEFIGKKPGESFRWMVEN